MKKALGAKNFRPAADPLPGGAGRPKFNQLEMVTNFTYKQGSSRTGTHGNGVPVLFYTTGTSFPLFFSLYTPIINCNFVESDIH